MHCLRVAIGASGKDNITELNLINSQSSIQDSSAHQTQRDQIDHTLHRTVLQVYHSMHIY
jgi:hypothetical protein